MKNANDPIAQAQNRLGFVQGAVFNLKLSWRLLKDARVPWLTKLVFPTTLVYVLSPVDFIPDIVLGLGQLDDLVALLVIGPAIFIGLCPHDVATEHRRALNGLPTVAQDSTSEPAGETVDGTCRDV